MEKIKEIFSNIVEKIKNNKLISIIIAILVSILLILVCVFAIIDKKNKEQLSLEQINAYMKELEATNSNFEDISQIKQGLEVYEISDEYGKELNEDEKERLIEILGYEKDDILESTILDTFKVYTSQELVESGVVISNEFLDIYGDEIYYISVLEEGNRNKNILVVLKDPRKIGTEDIYLKPEENKETLKIIQEGSEVEAQIPGIIVTKVHNAKAKIQFSYLREIVDGVKYSEMSSEELKEYEKPFFIRDNQLISTKFIQGEEEKEGNSKLVSCLKLLSPTYIIEEKEQVISDETISLEGSEEDVESNIKKIPTLVFAKVKGEGYRGEVKYKYRVEIINEEGYVIEEEEGEGNSYELTQEKRYNLYLIEEPKDENANILESDKVLIKINGSEIVKEEKSNNTQLAQSFKVEAINSNRRCNRYIIFRVG